MSKLKVIIGIIAFYLIIFHFFIRLTFFPNMPAEELVGLALMMMVSYNFFAYYKGWTMHLLYGHTKATDSQKNRLFALFISVLVVGGILYAWVKQGLESL